MLIDYSYFVGKINLPQTGNTDGRADVEAFIADYEPEYLQKVLGYSLWKAFTDGIDGSGAVDQRWTDLLDGADFSYDGKTWRWPGFVPKPSPVAQYVYYQFLENGASDTVPAGTATGKAENATRVSPSAKMLTAWNEMIKSNVLLWNFLNANKATYPEWTADGYSFGWYWYGYSWWDNHTEHRNELFTRKNSLDL